MNLLERMNSRLWYLLILFSSLNAYALIPSYFFNYDGQNSYMNATVYDSTFLSSRFIYNPNIGLKVNTNLHSFNYKLSNQNIGLNILNIQNGPFISNMGLYGRYSNKLALSNQASMVMGANIGFFSYSHAATNKYGGNTVWAPDAHFSIGLSYKRLSNYLSLRHSLNNEIFIDGVSIQLERQMSWTIMYEGGIAGKKLLSTVNSYFSSDALITEYFGTIQLSQWNLIGGMRSIKEVVLGASLNEVELKSGSLQFELIGSYPFGKSILLPKTQLRIAYCFK